MARRRRVRVERGEAAGFPLAAMRERPVPAFPWLRAILLGVVVIAALLGAAMATVRALIDLDALKAEAEAALREAIGQPVRIEGEVTILSYLATAVAIDRIVVANRAGSAQPDMLRIARLEAELGLGALLAGRFDIQRLVVAQPELLLEVDEAGAANWDQVAPAAARPATRRLPRNIHIKDGSVTYSDARTGRRVVVALRRISATEADAGGQMAVVGDLGFANQRIGVSGQIGPLARLLDRAATTPWPVRIALDTPGLRLAAAGTVRQPWDLAGYELKLDVSVADSVALAPFAPIRLPQLRTIVATGRIADTPPLADVAAITGIAGLPGGQTATVGPTVSPGGQGLPDISGARVQMGASDLSSVVPGLRIDALEVHMPALEEGLRGDLLGTLHGIPVRLQFSVGGIAAFLPAAPRRPDFFPVDITADVGDSRLAVKGAISAPGRLAGLELAVSARLRDLEALSPLAGRPLPAFRNLGIEAKLGDGPAGFAQGLAISELSVTGPQGDLAGKLEVQYGGRPALRGALAGSALDADAIMALLDGVVAVPGLVEPGPAYRPRSFGSTRVISDAKLRYAQLEAADIDLTLGLATLRALGMGFRDVAARVTLGQGRLAVGPVSALLPSGVMSFHLTADGRDPAHPMTVRARVPGLPVQPLLAAFSRRDNLFGDLEVEADLRARGASLRELAASVSGQLGVAIVEGDIDSRLLLDPLAEVMRAARVPINLATQRGMLSRLRCLATRLEAEEGQVRIAALALESGPILVEGRGSVDLAEEQWAARLVPSIRGGGQAMVVHTRLEGSFLTPRFGLDATPPQPRGVLPTVISPRAQSNPPAVGPSPPDACVVAVQAARGDRAGPMPGDAGARPAMVRPPPPRPLQ